MSRSNSRNDKSSSTESATIMAPLHYVTHKNHRDQEVGVDHIFIRPMISSSSNSHISTYKGTDKTPYDASEKSNIDHSSHDDDNSSSTTTTTTAILTTTSSTISTTTSTTTTIDTHNQESDINNNTETSLNSSHNSQSNLSEIASTISSTSSTIGHDLIPPSRIFVNTSQVLPTHLTCHYWKDDFHISDHRPIKTNIILMKNK